jgi:hypothetical protein
MRSGGDRHGGELGHPEPGAGRVRAHGRRVRAALTALFTAARRVGPLPRAVTAAVVALALLTTFASPPRTSPEVAPVAASDALDDGPTEVPAPLTDGGELAGDDLEGADADRDLPVGTDDLAGLPDDLGEERELSPFERSPVGGLEDDEVAPADLIVRVAEGRVDPDELEEPLTGAQHAAVAVSLSATAPTADDEDGSRKVSLLGIDGSTFRQLTPEVTASTDAVWERLSEGDVLVTHQLAEELDLELGGDMLLETETGPLWVRVGAFAANGAPPIADILVPVGVAAELGAEEPNTLVVAIGGGDPEQLGEALAEATGGEVDILRELAPPVADGATNRAQLQQHAPRGRIEPFTYTSRTDGRITIHGDWIERYIVPVQLPGMARTSCHRAMVPQLFAAVNELIERGLWDHMDPSQFAGCFMARHIDWNPSRPLSMHAWGLAIDFNSRDNWLGATPQMDPRVVETFKRWGFDWGGDWRRPDGMHFELARIVPTD